MILIFHPALYTETFVIEPLSELNLVDLNEVETSIGINQNILSVPILLNSVMI